MPAIRHPAVATSTLQELRRLAASPEVRWYQDDVYLCLETRPRSVATYDPGTGTVIDVTDRALAGADRNCAARDETSPLSARFDWTAQGLLWELGPYSDGLYSFVMDDGMTRIPVPPQGGYSWQVPALEFMQQQGVTLHRWSPEMLALFRSGWEQVLAEELEKDPTFARVWKSLNDFRTRYATWRDLGYLD